MDDREVTPANLRLTGRDVVAALVVSLTIISLTIVAVAALVEPAQPESVARVTTADLRAMADLGRAIRTDPESTPAEARVADRLVAVAEAVENGEVEIVPPTTTAAPPPPVPSTTTTTTVPPPPTTAPLGSRANPAPWPTPTVP